MALRGTDETGWRNGLRCERIHPPPVFHTDRLAPSVQVLPRVCSIKQPNPYRTQRVCFKVPCIDAHIVHLARSHSFPVHEAAACRAAHEVQCLATPTVRLSGARLADDSNVGRLVVRPKNAVSPANGAVAVCEHAWPTRNFDADGSAVTSARQHAAALLVTLDGQARRRAGAIRSFYRLSAAAGRKRNGAANSLFVSPLQGLTCSGERLNLAVRPYFSVPFHAGTWTAIQ